ncbi:hypothetical protein Bca101_098345 [Brassica carinata]
MTSSGASVANAAVRNAAVPNVAGAYSTFNTLRLDEQDSVIHGFIPANRASQFRSCLKAGSIVRLDGFEVARVAHMYKITELQFVIRIILSTRIVEVLADALVIKSDKFLVRRIDHLQVLANTNLELPGGYDLQNDAATSRIVVCLLFEPTVTVNVSLWDEAASAFRGLLRAGDKSQSVMLVTSVNPKLFGAQVYSCVDTLEGIKKKELVSIRDLNNFISNSNEQTQEADLLCKTRIVCVIPENGCVTSDVTGVVRFRVELAVDDGNDSATFVVSNGREEYLPSCLEELTGKEFVFQIRVTPFNFSPNHRTFTVSTITEDSTIANQMKHVHVTQEHSEGIIPNGSGDVGLTASSSGPSVLGFKNSEECVSAAPPENADTLKKRKRNHE